LERDKIGIDYQQRYRMYIGNHAKFNNNDNDEKINPVKPTGTVKPGP